jgi:transcriptional regulator with XRE-family HTH domain
MGPPTKKSEASAIGRRFGENVIWLRKEAGLSQQAIAERAGLHRVEISLIERGLRVPRLETILKLAGAVEVDPCELIRECAGRTRRLLAPAASSSTSATLDQREVRASESGRTSPLGTGRLGG